MKVKVHKIVKVHKTTRREQARRRAGEAQKKKAQGGQQSAAVPLMYIPDDRIISSVCSMKKGNKIREGDERP